MIGRLLQIATEILPGFQETLFATLDPMFVQGALLEVDRYWYWAALRAQAPWPWMFDGQLFGAEQWIEVRTLLGDLKLNEEFRPNDWPQHCQAMGYGTRSERRGPAQPQGRGRPGRDGATEPGPFVIRVLLRDPWEERTRRLSGRPKGTTVGGQGLPPAVQAALPFSYRGHAIVYELRPPAVGTSALTQLYDRLRSLIPAPAERAWPSGISVGRSRPDTAGTAGGCLIDSRSGARYLVTCAHVVGPPLTDVFCPGPFEGTPRRALGRVRLSAISPLNLGGQACRAATLPNAGRVDVALAEMWDDTPRILGSPHRLRTTAQMHPFQPVSFVGKVSGKVNAQMNCVSLWQEILTEDFGDGPSGWRCFGELFELAGRSGDVRPIAAEGDSGAWVIDEVEGLRSWDGVVVANQGTRAYGCFAEYIMDAIRAQPEFGLALTLPHV